MSSIKLSKEQVVEVLQRLREIIAREGPAPTKIKIKHRGNDDYFKVVKTQDKYGFDASDLLRVLGKLEFKDYHNSIPIQQGLYLHSFITTIEVEDVYIKFSIILSYETGKDTILLYSFHT